MEPLKAPWLHLAPRLRMREGYPAYGRMTWLPRAELLRAAMAAKSAQAWWLSSGQRFVSTVRVGRHWLRALWCDPDTCMATLEALLRVKEKPLVSSWGGVWRRVGCFIPPPSDPAARAQLAVGCWPYPWESSLPGVKQGTWNEWDLSSAFPWAGLTRGGLPAPWTLEMGNETATCDDTAVYLVKRFGRYSAFPDRPGVPPWVEDGSRDLRQLYATRSMFSEDPPHRYKWVFGEAANHLGLTWAPSDQVCSIHWRRTVDLRPAFDRVDSVFAGLPELVRKSVRAAYWGAWSKGAGAESAMLAGGKIAKTWALPNATNPMLAGILQSRVSSRLADVGAAESPRVFVDSVLLPGGYVPPESGTKPGQWKLKRTFAGGVLVPTFPRKPREVALDVKG